MLYRYDDFDDWRSRLFGGVDEERLKYLTAGREIMLSQENMFLTLSPEEALNPVWNASADWRPGQPRFAAADPEAVLLSEDQLDLKPGTLPRFWQGAMAYASEDAATACENLIGYFPVLVGRQHRVFCYRWHEDAAAAASHAQRQARSGAFLDFQRAFRDDIVARETRLFRTARVPWMRNLFAPMQRSSRTGA
jgi:hypothetical protein